MAYIQFWSFAALNIQVSLSSSALSWKGNDAFYISSSCNSEAAKKETSCLGAKTEVGRAAAFQKWKALHNENMQ